jgi:hypothetical protein
MLNIADVSLTFIEYLALGTYNINYELGFVHLLNVKGLRYYLYLLCYLIKQWENLNHPVSPKASFLTDPHCQFRGVGQGM